jgi:hypothetical protein
VECDPHDHQELTMYEGHLNDGSSVQAHSAGPLYPYVLFAKQVGDRLLWGVITPRGDEPIFGSYDNTADIALKMKAAYDRRMARANLEAAAKALAARN